MDPIRLGYRELFRVSAIMEPVRFGYTEFSVPVTTSLLASIFLSPLHFWIAFLIIICLRGWFDVIWNQLKATTVAIIWTTRQEVQPETEPAAAQFQTVAIVGDEHSHEERSTSDGDIAIEIDRGKHQMKGRRILGAAEPPSSRRRGQKRKANNTSSGNTSTPPTTSLKRQAREKPLAVPFPPIHNGSCTRARQKEMASSSVTELVQAVKKPRALSESTNRPFMRRSEGDSEQERSEAMGRRNSENMAPPRRNSHTATKTSMQ
ncbi:hypothetical protein F0562_012563 [Nyssa sinensis]|uniref:Uncharacterized protein n=1 Tax=Nyssa sinensis TaxID=561372 RepID=A0A5J4ZTL6_9ASTE|nr:hypothetical protein F0562_012563 [Nyssa sinensis]